VIETLFVLLNVVLFIDCCSEHYFAQVFKLFIDSCYVGICKANCVVLGIVSMIDFICFLHMVSFLVFGG